MKLVVALLSAAILVLAGMLVSRTAPEAPTPVKLRSFVPPLADAEPPEMLRIRQGRREFRYAVMSSSVAEVEVEILEFVDGVPPANSEPQRFRWPRNGFGLQEGDVLLELAPVTIPLHGRIWNCWQARVQRTSGVFHYWYTDELPVHGLLKLARDKDGVPDDESAYVALPGQESNAPRPR